MPLIPDIKISVQNQAQLILDPIVKGGQFLRSKNGQLLLYAGGFTAVFPVAINGEKWAFRCWHVPVTDASKRLKLVSEFILKYSPSYLIPLEYTAKGIVVKGEIFPTTRMKWIEGKTLKKYLCDNIDNKQSLLGIASSFLSLIEDMHRLGAAHGDLQHGNILVTDNEELYLIDYDSMYVPSMGDDYKDEIVGKDDYQHPKRKSNKISSSKVDYFSELVIYLSIIALAENSQLAAKYKLVDTEFLLFSAADFKDIKKSLIYKDLRVLDIPLVNHLLGTLCNYLKSDDINTLKPFTEDSSFKSLLSSYFKSEEESWEEVKIKNIIQGYEDFLRRFPHGRFNSVARRKLNELITEHKKKVEDSRWICATRLDTIDAYQAYLSETELGLYKNQAYSKIEEMSWARACRLKSEHAYMTYLKHSVLKTYKSAACQALDDIYWQKTAEIDTLDAYKNYLKRSESLKTEYGYSTPSNNQPAIKRLEELEAEFWDRLSKENEMSGFESYLKQFPSGRYTNACKIRLNSLKDDEAWQRALNTDTEAGYKKYMLLFPNGKHIEPCKDKIRSYEVQVRAKKIFTWVMVLTMIIAFVAGIVKCSQGSGPSIDPRPAGGGTTMQQPVPFTPQTIDVPAIEELLDAKLDALELQKRRGKQLDQNVLREAKALLRKLEKKSPNYNSFKNRIDRL